MIKFTNKDISDYYDQTEVHYKQFWKLSEAYGLHYGIWEEDTKTTSEAILNVNRYLIELGQVSKEHKVLDAGCGIGGTCFYLSENVGCETVGITLSMRQVTTATMVAKEKKIDHLCSFFEMDYTATSFKADTFDFVFAIESVGSASDKNDFFREMKRILKPGGRILLADTLKPKALDINGAKDLKIMLNGWAICDIPDIAYLKKMAEENGFSLKEEKDASEKIKKSIQRMYYAGYLGMIGSKVYNFFKKSSPFSRKHYKTGIAQKKAFDKGQWRYFLMVFEEE